MKAVIQRVSHAQVSVDGEVVSRIGHGFAILLGIHVNDTERDIEAFVNKTVNLRVMYDEGKNKMTSSILDTKGSVLLISQFTLCADLSYGRRPSFHRAMPPKAAEVLYQHAVSLFEKHGLRVETGRFGQYMEIELHNDGPVTIVME